MPEVRPVRLSQELGLLVAAFAERPVRLQDLLEITQGRGYTLLLALMALPFCTPIPLPGLSTPFGAVIALIGLRFALRQQPWLPRRLLQVQLPPRFFPQFLTATQRLVRGLELFLRPRWTGLLDTGPLRQLYGVMVFVSGLLLLLPLPVPCSNLLPALTVVLLALARLERDGYFIVAGLVVFMAAIAFFVAVFLGGAATVQWLHAGWDGAR